MESGWRSHWALGRAFDLGWIPGDLGLCLQRSVQNELNSPRDLDHPKDSLYSRKLCELHRVLICF